MTIEPAKETDPTKIVNPVAARSNHEVADVACCSSSRATRAAAPPPTPLNSATICGIWVICTRRAPKTPPAAADRDREQDQRHVVEVEVEERDDAGDHGAGRADQVAGACGLGPGEALQREDEADRRREVDQLDPDRGRGAHLAPSSAAAGFFFLRVNICSIRSVTTKPPTMLTAASTIATSPTTSASVFCPSYRSPGSRRAG